MKKIYEGKEHPTKLMVEMMRLKIWFHSESNNGFTALFV